MRCKIKLLNEFGESWFEGSRDLPDEYILKLAAERKPFFAGKGIEFAEDAIPVFGSELVKVVKAGSSEDVIDKAVIEFVLATVTVQSFLGASDEELLNHDYSLVVPHDGTVQYDRLNIRPN
ncbi:hypothetical protein JH25_27740 [Pseudomonas sp. BRG-100]|uniref:hypothetical protein n=1 Tax=Pseudomonas sp. BRG-100 TaxID=1524267 RepID=UPI0004E7801F|nr:hypothetical protein [Pseudomonas sp. BRG-100]KFF42165.1 hypothetical protein JH25_27740 [Pseudomonas sp. BRG-100]